MAATGGGPMLEVGLLTVSLRASTTLEGRGRIRFLLLSRNGNRQNNGRETVAASERDIKG